MGWNQGSNEKMFNFFAANIPINLSKKYQWY